MFPRHTLLSLTMLALVLAGCNLGQAVPTPTSDPNILRTWTPVPVTPIVQPTSASPLPSGQMLPTAQPLPNTPEPPPPRPVTPVMLTMLPLGTPLTGAVLPALSAAGAASRYPITLRAGSTVGINYAVTVQGGSAMLVFQGAEGILWQQTFTASDTGRAEVTVTQGGAYELLAFTERFDGSYNISWG